ncbi:MAG: LOG family protein, partial [Chlamydiota bacterium]|nr:LOG family protein [Chlamydiota bacterium]
YDAGGHTIGVTCSKFKDIVPNPWIVESINTLDVWERLKVFLDKADGFLVLEGGTGTLMELSSILEMVGKRFIPAKPVLFFKEFWRPVLHIFHRDSKLQQLASFCSEINGVPDFFCKHLMM